MKNLGLKLKIVLGSSSPMILVIALCIISAFSIKSLLDSNSLVDFTHGVISEGMKLEAAAVDMETGMRGYLLAGKEEFLDPYKGGKERFDNIIGDLKNTLKINPEQVKLLEEIDSNFLEWQRKITEPAIDLRREIGDSKSMNHLSKEVAKGEGKKYFDEFRSKINIFILREQNLMKKRKRRMQAATSKKALLRDLKWVDHTYEVIMKAQNILKDAIDMETGMRGYLLSGKNSFLEPYENGSKSLYESIDQLSIKVSDNPKQVLLLSQIKGILKEWQENVATKMINLRTTIGDSKTMDDMAYLVGQAKGKTYFDKFRGQMKMFKDREYVLMKKRQDNASEKASLSTVVIYAGMVTIIMGTVIMALFIAGSIMRPFQKIFGGLKSFSVLEISNTQNIFNKIIGGLHAGAKNVESVSMEVAQGSNEQAASLQEISSSVEELSSMTQQSARNAEEANQLAQKSRQTAEQGEVEIQNLISSMHEISEGSKKIEEIIKVIDDISFQTNLLALNAAVEAARAGEQGKGFAVVAEAVRNLAVRSANSAKEITTLIKESVAKSDNGVEVADSSGKVLQDIVSNTKRVSELVNETSSASQEQASGLNQISKAINQLDQITQSNAAVAEELSAASNVLAKQTDELSRLLGYDANHVNNTIDDNSNHYNSDDNDFMGGDKSVDPSNVIPFANDQRGIPDSKEPAKKVSNLSEF